jgi:RimJ/RimL family protein N-acetyltransferase
MGLSDSPVSLSGRLVILRPISRADYSTLFRWRASMETVHMLNFSRKIATFEQFVGELEPLLQSSVLLLIEDARSNRPIGYALAYHFDQWDGWLFVGMYLEPQFRLKGHGGEAALLCVDALFRWFPIRIVYTEVYDFAQPLLRLVESMGFQEVGHQPDHYWHEDRFWGITRLGLTREAWLERREHFAAILSVERHYEQIASERGGA